MEITKEQLVERIEVLKQKNSQLNEEYRQVVDQINACMGAIQECEFWLARLEQSG